MYSANCGTTRLVIKNFEHSTRDTVMHKVFLFAGLAAIGNAIFVYGQRSSTISANPFIYMFGAILVCLIMFATATWLSGGNDRMAYLDNNPVLFQCDNCEVS